MEYRILPAAEFSLLGPFCERNKMPLPVENMNLVVVAEDQGEIVARWDILMQPHLDNGCIDEEYRGKHFIDVRKMFTLLEDQIKNVEHLHLYSTSTVGPKASRLLELLNFKAAPEPLYMKEY